LFVVELTLTAANDDALRPEPPIVSPVANPDEFPSNCDTAPAWFR